MRLVADTPHRKKDTMTLELVTAPVESSELESMELDQLAEEMRTAYGLARVAGIELLKQSIRIGEILNVASERMNGVELEEWVWQNIGVKRTALHRFRRFAKYREYLEQHEPANIQEAEHLLLGIDRPGRIPIEECQRIKEMFDAGESWQDIAEKTGLSKSAVWRRLHKQRAAEVAESNRESAERERDRIRRQRRDSAARKAGGTVGHAYSAIRRAAEAIDAACADSTNGEVRALLTQALNHQYRAEDEIVRALGVE